jgi:hypothetical protein
MKVLSIEDLYKKTYLNKRVMVYLLRAIERTPYYRPNEEYWCLYPDGFSGYSPVEIIQDKTALVTGVYYDRNYEDVEFWVECQDIGKLRIRE